MLAIVLRLRQISDVLAQHLRRCDTQMNPTNQSLENAPKQRSRTKKACDQCAKSKSKCDSQDPCSRCSRQQILCQYTRDGPLDLYSSYRITNNGPPSPAQRPVELFPPLNENEIDNFFQSLTAYSRVSDIVEQNKPSQSQHEVADTITSASARQRSIRQIFGQQVLGEVLDDSVDFGSFDLDLRVENSPIVQYSDIFGPYQSLQSWPINPVRSGGENASDECLQNDKIVGPFDVDNSQVQQNFQSPTRNGFSLEQMDPVEAKCEEIRSLLKGSEPLVTHDMISVFVTRENLFLFSQLYGQHFQRNFPILHVPSFRLIQTPAFLLLAIMIAGSCYSNNQVPISSIIGLAMQTLTLIEDQPVSFSPA